MKKYTVKDLSEMAGISIRSLHHYDKLGLLKPAFRSEKKYRLYGENELLRLQQILFYKEMEFPLSEISDMLNDKNFNRVTSLEQHKSNLLSKQKRISTLLKTIDKTIIKLKTKKMITDKELYEGFPKNEVEKIRKESAKKFGADNVQTSEKYLKSLDKEDFKKLIKEQKEIFRNLLALSKEKIESEVVQLEIAKHYQNTRKFWGTFGSSDNQKNEYKGLGKLYIDDKRYTAIDGQHNDGFPEFLSNAMRYFAKTQL